MRLPLSMLEVFAAIAQRGSLRGAADQLGLTPSTVSHQLKSLEQQLGVVLFARTTRSVTLTQAGQELARGAGPAFDQLAAALQSAQETGHGRRGLLRISMPEFAYDRVIADGLPSFRERYPDIELETNFSEAFVNIFEDGFHAGIRFGDRVDKEMIAVRVGPPVSRAVHASEDYLRRHGVPQTPRDLTHHHCIRIRLPGSGRFVPWTFVGSDGEYTVDVHGSLIVNRLPVLFHQVRAGLGLGYAMVEHRPGRSDAKLVHLLTDHIQPESGVFIYYPREYRNMELLRVFVEHFRWTE
ncbi:MAG: LysR family transcriptional regulator [Hyphomicrobiales bacterium]|nr:LysR family transcriptional regulator [Hyphomicrobiales bacterium]